MGPKKLKIGPKSTRPESLAGESCWLDAPPNNNGPVGVCRGLWPSTVPVVNPQSAGQSYQGTGSCACVPIEVAWCVAWSPRLRPRGLVVVVVVVVVNSTLSPRYRIPAPESLSEGVSGLYTVLGLEWYIHICRQSISK